MIVRFPSIPAYIQAVRERCDPAFGGTPNQYWLKKGQVGCTRDWDMGVKSAQACEMALAGDPTLAATATDAMSRIQHVIGQGDSLQVISDVAGGWVNVPSAIAGHPLDMRRRVKRIGATRCVSVYVCTGLSAMITDRDMLKRGCTILALIEALQASRIQVDLYLVDESDGQTDGSLYQVTHVDSQPLDLSTACFAIAHPAFARNVTFPMATALDGFRGHWPSGFDMHDSGENSKYHVNLRKLLDMAPTDILIPAANVQDALMRDPETWLAQRIQQYTGQETTHLGGE